MNSNRGRGNKRAQPSGSADARPADTPDDCTQFSIPKAAFKNLSKDVLDEVAPDKGLRLGADAVAALQEVCEADLVARQ